ncbi:O-antigen ligase-like membrane protein [Sphingomonas sp. PP-CC-3A-396]|nr:O-antigen ligase-like membrane protein [Sphingomonas sp. PP-CC-3A-396]
MLGLVQILGGGNSPAYLYRPTSLGLPVGLFANRNHQAVFLALALAPLSVWGLRSRGKIALPIRIAMVVGGILLSLPVIILTGSRSGLIMTFGVLLLLPWILRVSLKRRLGNTRSQIVTYAALAVVVLVVAVIGYMVSNDQATSISRLLDTNELRAEKRILAAPVMIHMLKDFFPVGIGYGAFEPLFRAYEPDALLTPTYFNRAHNDVLELAMSGGLLTIAVMVVFAGWFVQRCIALFRNNERGLPAIYARLSAVLILGLILASITDYPVRTPIITAVFALACMWLEDGSRRPPNIVESER